MSLLDRVQRKAEGTPPSSAPSAPSPSAPPGAPDRPSDDGAERFPPAGWQNRPGGVSQAPVPATPAPAARPFEVERPAHAPEPQRAPTLLNRAGGMRPGLSKMGGHVNTHVALRGKVHQRLVEELAQGTDSVPPEVVRQRIGELLNDVIPTQTITRT